MAQRFSVLDISKPRHLLCDCLFDSGKSATGGIIKNDPTARQYLRHKMSNVALHRSEIMAAVDPEQRNRPLPSPAHFLRKSPHDFQAALGQLHLLDRLLKGLPRAAQMRIDADHLQWGLMTLGSLDEPGSRPPLPG